VARGATIWSDGGGSGSGSGGGGYGEDGEEEEDEEEFNALFTAEVGGEDDFTTTRADAC
jgi:hypothetical protein